MYEITFCDTGRTIRMSHIDAEDLFGRDEFSELRQGYSPNIVVVEL